MDTYHRYK
ncbi:unnamed protein product, partial [Rotaria sp. Silwood1]